MTSEPDIFPIKLISYEKYSYTDMEKIWHRIRPKGKSWYMVDFVINSPQDVTIKMYGMESTYYGGKGRLEDTYEVTEGFTEEETAIIDRYIMEAQLKWAEREYEDIEYKKRNDAILKIRNKNFKKKLTN